MKRSSERIDRLTVKNITLESKNGSVTLSADNNSGRVVFETLNKVESGSFSIDLKNEAITAENVFIKKINFYDGTYLDSAALINETIGNINQSSKTIELKPNKIFFKYNGDNTPGAGQQIEIKVLKSSSLVGTPVVTITPNNVGITLNQVSSDTYVLTVAEFHKASSDTIEIQATLTNSEGTFTDVLTIYKTRDGTDALVGGLSNPFLALQANSAGEVTDLATILSGKGRGTFTVFKGAEELTNSGKVTYSVQSVTDNLIASINPTTGIYTISNWSPDELVGEAIFAAIDNITNQQIKGKFTIITSKQGQAGLTGTGARTVKLIADDQQIAYKSDDDLLAPTSIQITASQQNHVGTVYYEFIVYDGLSNVGITLYNGTNDNILLTNTNKNYGSSTYTFIESTKTGYGKSKTLKVRTRENSPSAPIISSEDVINIIATRDGSDAFELVFSNTNHSFPANSNGDVALESYTGGGSIVEAYIGNEQLSPVLGIPANGQFTVSVSEQQNITSGLIQPDPNSAIKRMNIGDPSSFISNKDSGSITYTITGKSSNGVSKTQLEKVSFTKSKQGIQGLPGSSGTDARAVELVSNIYQFNYNSSNTASPADGFTLTVSPKNATGAVTYKFYKNNVLVSTQTGTTLTRTDIPIFNNSDSWKVELLEDGIVKAIDTVSIYGTKDGSDAITLIVPNDNHTFTADSTGGSINFAGSETTIKLLIGSTPLNATTSSPPSSGQFNASLSGIAGITLGSITVTADDTLTLGQAIAFDGNSGTATLSVNFIRPGSTTTETITKILTYSKSKQGLQGQNGSSGIDARAVELVSNLYQFNYNSSNIASPTSGFILTASPKNTSGTVSYKFYKNNVLIATQSETTLASTDIPIANNSDSWKVELLEDGTVKAVDTVSIYGTKDGSDAITLVIPNDNHTFTADSAGGSINFAGSGTTIKILVGSTFLNATTSSPPSSGQFNASLSGVSGITLGSITVTADDTLTLGPATAFGSDSGTATLTANFRRPGSTTTETITKILTYSKSKQGLQGLPGSSGNNARAVELSATRYQVPYNNAIPSTTNVESITLTATPRNVIGTVTYRFLIDNTQVQATSEAATFVVSGINLPAASSTKTCRVEMFENGTLVAIDTISLVGTKDGSDAVTVEIPNNNHTFTCDVNGTPQTFNGSGTTVRVYIGNTSLTATNSAPTAGQFKVSVSSISPTGAIVVPTPSVAGNTATIGNLSNFTADSATVTYTIEFRRPNSSTTETLTQIGTYSKSKTGQVGPDGADGTDGTDGVDGIDLNRIWDFNQTFQYDSATLVPYGWNITPSSSTDLTAGNAADNVLAPKFEPSGNYKYPYLSGSGYAGRFGALNLPIGLTVTSSQDSKHGGKLGNFCIQSFSSSIGTNQSYIYSAEPIPISVGNTYELAYRVKQNTNFISTQIGLFFFDIEGKLITSVDTDTSIISYAQTSFPHVKDTISSGFQSWTADRVVGYYSFESGGSLKTFPSDAKYVKPYIRLKYSGGGTQGATAIRQLLIDYLYFGEKTTPNSRTGIWIDPITGRVTIGEANADIAGGSGGLQASKYDATANFEIISSGSGIGDVSDIKITRAHPYVYTSASYSSDVAIGRDFAAIRFAGWDGTFAGASISSPGNMKIDERAEIRASYARTGSADTTAGALGGACLDFYTAPSRTTASFLATTPTLTASAPVLRARITDQGQLLVGYNDATTQIINQGGTPLNPDTGGTAKLVGGFGGTMTYVPEYLYDSSYYPVLAVSGPIASNGFFVGPTTKPSYINNRMMVKSLTPIIKTAGEIGITYTGSIGEPNMKWPSGYFEQLNGGLISGYLNTGYINIDQNLILGTNSKLGIGFADINANPSYALHLTQNSAAKPSTNTWTISSDIRVKENIQNYSKGLETLIQLNPVTYDYNGKAGFDPNIKNNIGLIAQDIKDILSESINTYKAKLEPEDLEDTELYNFDSHALTYVMINSIKQLVNQINNLKNEIEVLKSGSI